MKEHIYIFDYDTNQIYHKEITEDESAGSVCKQYGLSDSCICMITSEKIDIKELV